MPVLAAGACKEVRVLTYNIHHGEGIDGKFDLARIAKVIRKSRAHIVALQEVDQRTKRWALFGKSMEFDGGEYGNALLVKG